MDSEDAHRIVGASMLTTFLVVLIAQNWFKHIRDWIGEQTHVGFAPTPDPNVPMQSTAVHWLVGIGGTWIILSLLAESEDSAPFAAGFAGLIAFGVVLRFGVDALNNLQGTTTAKQGGAPSVTNPSEEVGYYNPPGTTIVVPLYSRN